MSRHERHTKMHRAARRGAFLLVACLVAALATASVANAQLADLDQRCMAGGGHAGACRSGVDMLHILSARATRIAAGGNPVLGTASTFGRRVSAPRVALSARLTAGSIDLPEPRRPGREDGFTAWGFHGDLVIGLFDGWNPAPTVGGLGSVDLLGSVGTLRLPESRAFASAGHFTWAAGLRLGVLRESFTAPGISITGMYRRVGDIRLGDPGLASDSVHVELEDLSAWDATIAVGKRVGVFGLTAGGGWSNHDGSGTLRARGGSPISADDFGGSRVHLFGNISWTSLVWSFTGELGWQNGGGALHHRRQRAVDSNGGGWFGGLAARLTI